MKYKTMMILFILIFFTIIAVLSGQVNASNAEITASIGDKAQLDKGTLGFYSIEKKKSDGTWVYLTYSIIKYADNSGNQHVAYCLDESKYGVGYVNGDVDGYEVQLTKFVSDDRIWRVIINGYPYKTPEQLGVETEEDAYLATKRAVYSMVSGYTVQDVLDNYRVGTTKINGQNLNDIQRRGEKVIRAICNLVDIGNNGTQTITKEAKVVKLGEFQKNENNNCYYQRYTVKSGVEISEYTINEILNFPEGTRIVDSNGVERTTFLAGEEFRVVVDANKIVDSFEGKVNINAKCKVYPIYYGTAPEGYQDYAICSGYWDNLYTNTSLKVNTNSSSLKIIKKDKDTNETLQGVKFELSYEDGRVIGEYITDENGEIQVEKLNPGNIKVKEIETIKGYILNDKEIITEIKFNENKEVEIFNEKEPKAELKIVKKDKDTYERLQGVIFEVKYENGELIGEYTTDENGEILIKDLRPETVIIKEIKTIEGYILDQSEKKIELPKNNILEMEMFNEKIPKAYLKIIKMDEDTKKRLEGVIFEVKYENGELIGEYMTDENGEILIKDLRPETVIIKEINTIQGYILSGSEKKIELTKDNIIEVEILNKKIQELSKLPRTGDDRIKVNLIEIIILFTMFIGKRIILLQ